MDRAFLLADVDEEVFDSEEYGEFDIALELARGLDLSNKTSRVIKDDEDATMLKYEDSAAENEVYNCDICQYVDL